MSLDRRKFMHGVAGGFLSYGFLKPRILTALGGRLRTFKQQRIDTDLSGILHNLAQATLVILLDDTAHPDGTIKPGQRISFSWAVYDWVTALSVDGSLRESPRYASSEITLFYQGNPIFGPSRQHSAVVPVTADVAHDFYQIGATDHVTAELSAPPGGAAVTASFYLFVVADNAPSWEWGELAARFRWNRDHYTPTGILHNNSDYGTLSFMPVLRQIDFGAGGETPLPPVSYTPSGGGGFTILPHGTANVPFPTIQQTWPWFDRATLFPFGPYSRGFGYSVDVTGTDQFGNRYSATSETRRVFVAVEDVKTVEEGLALTAQLAAILFGLIGLYYPLALIAAAGLETAAQLAVTAALDPPEPDPDYLTRVPGQSTKAANSSPSALLADLILQIAQTPQTLSAIEAKIMGAKENNSAEGLALQQKSYIDAIRKMNDAAQQLGKALPAALEELHARPEVNDKNMQRARETFAKGVPDDILNAMRSAKLSKEAEIMFVKAVNNPEVMKQLPDLDKALTNAATRAAYLALTLQNETPHVVLAKPKRVLKDRK